MSEVRKERSGRAAGGEPESWSLELHTERGGFGWYAYRRVRVERAGRRASAREFTLRLDWDQDLQLATRADRMVRQRGRSLTAEECAGLWERLTLFDPWALPDSLPCSDHVAPGELDDSMGIDGRPIAVSTGEEGPACVSVREGRDGPVRRVVVERFREPPPELAHRARARSAPLAALWATFDGGLSARQPFNYRRTRPFADLAGEFQALSGLAFLNLRQFERRCLEAISALHEPEALPLLTRGLFSSDPLVQLQALDGLAELGDEAAASEIELLYYADEPAVRERARQVLELLRLLRAAR